MTSDKLANLAKTGLLHEESPAQKELDGLLTSAISLFKDVTTQQLSTVSQFDLTYNAAHALAFAAMRYKGYRTDKRNLVFQCLSYTTGISTAKAKVFSLSHGKRNVAAYEGDFNVDERFLGEFIELTGELLDIVEYLIANRNNETPRS